MSHPDGSKVVCSAHGVGGNIDVVCNNPSAGRLVVEENSWSGWSARLDGGGFLPIEPGRWLSLDIPAGVHTIQLRYRPWDVLVGGVLFVVGAIVAMWYWRRRESGPGGFHNPSVSLGGPAQQVTSDIARAELG